MSATRATSVPGYFQKSKRLDKSQFFEKFSRALKKTVLKNYPLRCGSPEVQLVAEQAWKNYSNVCEFFDDDKIFEGDSINYVSDLTPLQNLNGLYFQVYRHGGSILSARTRHFAEFIWEEKEFQDFSKTDKDKSRVMLNLPKYILSPNVSDIDQSLVNYTFEFTITLASTHYPCVMALIQLGVDINQYSPMEGNNPFLLAVSKGWNHQNPDAPVSVPSTFYPQKEIIQKLLEIKADVNAIHLANGMTALHIACLRGDDPEFIKLLLAHGAKFDAKDYEGHTPLTIMDSDYSSTQTIIRNLTNSINDYALIESFNFGCRGLPEYRSNTATLPTQEARLKNQTQIRKILAEQLENSRRQVSESVLINRNVFVDFSVPKEEKQQAELTSSSHPEKGLGIKI